MQNMHISYDWAHSNFFLIVWLMQKLGMDNLRLQLLLHSERAR